MKKIFLLLIVMLSVSSCATNRTYIRDYSRRVELVKTNFLKFIDYTAMVLLLSMMYIFYEKDGHEQVGINYRYQ